ncbi:MAG TPA: AAA family ATPase, partial [Rugosimonospora sp.]|nr:AAA family ATPase [Rugosimonospora sp.]
RAYARIAAALGLIPRDHVEEVDRAGLVGHHLGETERLTAAAFERARGGVLFVDEAYALAPNDEGRDLFGQAAIDTLVKRMEDAREDVIVIIAGYPSEMERLLDANPGLRSRFTTTIHFPNYTTAELVAIFDKFARDEAYRLTGGARAELTAFFGRLPRGRDFGNARTARVLFQAARDQLARRLAPVADPDADALSTLLPADITAAVAASGLGHGQGVPDTAQVARLLDQLDGMIGLTPVKREIRELVAQQENARRRVAEGLPVEQHPRHLLFVGPPGTGKTEVARLYGRLLAALGVLSQGEFVEAARSDLVAGWVGQTALKTAAAFTRARGGVLFIDEAYSLAPHHGPGNDFGAEALDTLVKLMEDRRDEVVVIAAGYPDEMDRLLSANSGLRSRFGRRVEFPAYSVDELVAIFERMVGARGYLATPETVAAVRTHLAGIERDRTFGNGRYVRQLLDSMLARQAVRLQATPSADRAALSTLLPEDLGTA